MFPALKQRVGIFVACLVGSLLLAQAAGGPGAGDVELGWRLWGHAGSGGGISGGVSIGVWMLPVVVMGGVLGGMGNVLAGWFVVSFVLMTLAWRGGSIDGWMRRSALPGEYWSLAKEAVVWMVFLLAAMWVVQWISTGVRKKRRTSESQASGGMDGAVVGAISRVMSGGISGGVTAVVGGLLGHVLIRSSQPGQVMIGLMVAFMVGGLAGTLVQAMVLNKGAKKIDNVSVGNEWTNALGMMVSPGVVAVAMYGWMAMSKQGHEEILSAWYRLKLSGLVQVMPVQYVAAGCVGVILGIGWAQGLMQPEETPAKTQEQAGGEVVIAIGQTSAGVGGTVGGPVGGGGASDGISGGNGGGVG